MDQRFTLLLLAEIAFQYKTGEHRMALFKIDSQNSLCPTYFLRDAISCDVLEFNQALEEQLADGCVKHRERFRFPNCISENGNASVNEVNALASTP